MTAWTAALSPEERGVLMNKLDLVMAEVNKKYGEEIVSRGVKRVSTEKVPVSSARLSYLLYGGLPSNQAVELFGPEHGGKTTLALDIVKNVQAVELAKYADLLSAAEDALLAFVDKGDVSSKAYKAAKEALDKLEADGHRRCIYVDAENTLDLDWATKLGVDTEDMILVRPQAQSAEQVFQMVLNIIDSGQAACVVIDSLPMLVPKSIFDEDMEKKAYCGISGPLSVFCSKVVGLGKLHKNNTMLVGINQVREDINNPYNQFSTPGGRAWRHLCTVRLLVRHGYWFNEENEEMANKDAKTPAGNVVDVSIAKIKCAKSDRRLGFFRLNYETGIDVLADMLDVAILFDLVEKSGSWYTLPGGNKVQGMKAVHAYFTAHPEEIQRLQELLAPKILGE